MGAKELILSRLKDKNIDATDVKQVKIYNGIDKTIEIKFTNKENQNCTTIAKYRDIKFSDEELAAIKSEGLLNEMRNR